MFSEVKRCQPFHSFVSNATSQIELLKMLIKGKQKIKYAKIFKLYMHKTNHKIEIYVVRVHIPTGEAVPING